MHRECAEHGTGKDALRPRDLAYFRVAAMQPASAGRALAVEVGHTDVTLEVSVACSAAGCSVA
jgi:hypothetical protein